MCVYVSPRLLKTMQSHEMKPEPIKQVLLLFGSCITFAINITDGCGLSNEARYQRRAR